MDDDMEAAIGNHGHEHASRGVLHGLRPAFPAAATAFGLALLAAFVMPMDWVSAICWQLYLDTIHPIFVEPLGNATRLALGFGLGIVAMLLATLLALALATTEIRAFWPLRSRSDAAVWDDFDDDMRPILARRRADEHPDAPPVAPINALRDLPPEGLVPQAVPPITAATAPLLLDAVAADPSETVPVFSEPLPDPDDMSLGAMVSRFEIGLDRRRSGDVTPATSSASEDDAPMLDLALEAALSTLQRMNKAAVG